jgi:alkyl hydroperoxide reductase subunit AhpC
MAKIEPEFIKRNAKLIGLSIDPVESHAKWVSDIEETQGATVKYPMIGDTDLNVAKLLPQSGQTSAPTTIANNLGIDRSAPKSSLMNCT